jgi:hypothetical protein
MHCRISQNTCDDFRSARQSFPGLGARTRANGLWQLVVPRFQNLHCTALQPLQHAGLACIPRRCIRYPASRELMIKSVNRSSAKEMLLSMQCRLVTAKLIAFRSIVRMERGTSVKTSITIWTRGLSAVGGHHFGAFMHDRSGMAIHRTRMSSGLTSEGFHGYACSYLTG